MFWSSQIIKINQLHLKWRIINHHTGNSRRHHGGDETTKQSGNNVLGNISSSFTFTQSVQNTQSNTHGTKVSKTTKGVGSNKSTSLRHVVVWCLGHQHIVCNIFVLNKLVSNQVRDQKNLISWNTQEEGGGVEKCTWKSTPRSRRGCSRIYQTRSKYHYTRPQVQ